MFWVTRKGRRYLYETRREGSRVRKVYLGCGPLAEALMASAQDATAALASHDGVIAEDEEKWAEAERLTAELASGVTVLARAALLAAGYHQHQRGDWRKRRAPKEGTETEG